MEPKCLCKYNIFLLYFNSNKYISKKNSKQCFPKRGMEMFLSTQSVWFNYVKVPRLDLIWHPGTQGALATVQNEEKEMQPLQWWLSPDENAISEASKIQKCNSWFSLDENAIWDISEIIYQFPARHKFTMLRKRNQAISCSPYMELSVYLNRLRKSKNDVFKVLSHFVPFL